MWSFSLVTEVQSGYYLKTKKALKLADLPVDDVTVAVT